MPRDKDFVLTWKGDDLADATFEAARGAVDAVLQRTIELASATAPRRSGHLAGSFRREPARREMDNIVGRWGNDAFYFFIVEARHPSQAGFARRAADTTYPTLTDEIKRRLPK